MTQGYYRFPTICQDTVVFVSEDDLWTVPAAGGIARRLTSNLGEVNFPALSPDGESLAFVGRDEGRPEVYLMPAGGGSARRLTYLNSTTQVLGWSRDGASTWLTVGLRGARPADEEIRALFALVAEGLGAQGEPPWSWDGEAAWAEIGVAGAPGWDAERPPGDPPAAPSPSAYFDRGATDVRGHGREAPPDR